MSTESPLFKKIKASSESSIQIQSVTTLKTLGGRKLSPIFVNKSRKLCKKNVIKTKPSSKAFLQCETETELITDRLHEIVRLPPKKIFVPNEMRFKDTFHLPVKCKSRRCAYCSTMEKPHRTRVMCETCNVGLCMHRKRDCFELFHKVKKLKKQ